MQVGGDPVYSVPAVACVEHLALNKILVKASFGAAFCRRNLRKIYMYPYSFGTLLASFSQSQVGGGDTNFVTLVGKVILPTAVDKRPKTRVYDESTRRKFMLPRFQFKQGKSNGVA